MSEAGRGDGGAGGSPNRPAKARRRHFPRLSHDRRRVAPGGWLVGVDEAGRGAWAGPVVAAAVAVPEAFLFGSWCRRNAPWVDDSKRVDPRTRAQLVQDLGRPAAAGLIAVATAEASIAEIEEFNILGATRLAMRRALAAVEALGVAPRLPQADESRDQLHLFDEASPKQPELEILIDGLPLKDFSYQHIGLVKGDGTSFVIALASLVAKVTRDQRMAQLEETLPGWDWAAHKGYGVPSHAARILSLGPTAEHRPSFLRKLHEQLAIASTPDLFEAADDDDPVEDWQ